MPKNKIVDLRNHLFLALEKLHDKEIDIDTALAIADVSKQIIESAKVEMQYLKLTESTKRSLFIEGNKNDEFKALIE